METSSQTRLASNLAASVDVPMHVSLRSLRPGRRATEQRRWANDMSAPLFTIEARIDHLSGGVGCFDPVQVLHRMRGAFPDLAESTGDYLLETCDSFRKLSEAGAEKALRIAVRDMQERGPKVLFEIPSPDGRSIRGTAERYWVSVTSQGSDFPDGFRQRFIAFLKTLKLQPIQIRHGREI